MSRIGLFFGTSTGTTRLIAKKLAKRLGEAHCEKPLNINRASVADLLACDALILGTPSYANGRLPGVSTGVKDGSWEEFLPHLAGLDLRGKTVALYGLGNQEKYPDRFADALRPLYDLCRAQGATVIGQWSTEGYGFRQSKAVLDGRFVGLVVDNNTQPLLTEPRLDAWVEAIRPALLQAAGLDAGVEA